MARKRRLASGWAARPAKRPWSSAWLGNQALASAGRRDFLTILEEGEH